LLEISKGAIMLNDEAMYKQMKYLQNAIGAVPAPFDCFMVARGLKTLGMRMRLHQENGLKIAKSLENNPRISKIIYPGLESHPQHELFKRQMKGFGGMISVYVKGDLATTVKFLKSLKVSLKLFLI
jgi:cystathionine gamma-lyase